MAFTESEKSKVFVKITKTKVMAAYGQLIEVLFSTGKFPLGVQPTKIPEGVALDKFGVSVAFTTKLVHSKNASFILVHGLQPHWSIEIIALWSLMPAFWNSIRGNKPVIVTW